jgi:hypothetical protein
VASEQRIYDDLRPGRMAHALTVDAVEHAHACRT